MAARLMAASLFFGASNLVVRAAGVEPAQRLRTEGF